MGPKNLTYDRLMKIEWLIIHVRAGESPTKVESGFYCNFGCLPDNSGRFCDEGAIS